MTMPVTSAGGLEANQMPFLAQRLREPTAKPPADPALREAFDDFVGETFYSQMLGAMRKTQGKPAYFHGGRAEEIFQEQLDQTWAKDISRSSADQFTGPMFDLFTLQRK